MDLDRVPRFDAQNAATEGIERNDFPIGRRRVHLDPGSERRWMSVTRTDMTERTERTFWNR